MGYSRIVQYGNITELYEYEKNITTHKRKSSNALSRKRARDRKLAPNYQRSDFSIKRARRNFFRLCHANVIKADSVHFLTLTLAYDANYTDCLRYISRFFSVINKDVKTYSKNRCEGYTPVSYISVPEKTKAGRWHFHLLIFDLPTRLSGNNISIRVYNYKRRKFEVVQATTERFTRNLQRKWGRGFLDICPARYTTRGIAGYMAKYMAKTMSSPEFKTRRAYNCSRQCEKVYCAGSNSFATDPALFIPDKLAERKYTYKVPYLGTCTMTRYVVD